MQIFRLRLESDLFTTAINKNYFKKPKISLYTAKVPMLPNFDFKGSLPAKLIYPKKAVLCPSICDTHIVLSLFIASNLQRFYFILFKIEI